MDKSEVTKIIRQVVLDLKCGLDPLMVLAIAEVESALVPHAVRYEPHWRYFTMVDKYAKSMRPPVTTETERVMQSTSWGVMQVMGSVARELGHKTHLTELVDPRLSTEYGVRHLMRLRRQDYTDLDLISAYNSGRAYKFPNGRYANQNYVDKVETAWMRLKLAESPVVIG